MKLSFNIITLVFLIFCQDSLIGQAQRAFKPEKPTSVETFFSDYHEVLQIDKNTKMVEKTKNIDKSGNLHTRYQQYYKGVKVVGGTYILHSKNDLVMKSNGVLAENLNMNTTPFLEREEAIHKAKLYFIFDNLTDSIQSINVNKVPLQSKTNLCIIGSKYPSPSKDYLLAVEVKITFKTAIKKIIKIYYIDAISGNKISSFDAMPHTSIIGKGQSNFYSNVDIVMDSISPNLFLLHDSLRNITVYRESTGAVYSNDTKEWTFESEGDKSAVDVMYGTGKFYDLMLEKFGLKGIDNQSGPLNAGVNIALFNNAYWDGEATHFGSGDCYIFYPFTAIDVVGHEFAHGLTEFHSNLIYSHESGAMNEAMSDIIGKSLEKIYHPESFSWGIGGFFSKIRKDFRNMDDPNLTNNPKYYKGLYWWDDFWDNYGVHTNSGVLNHWFYLLTEGGSGVNEGDILYNVQGIGIDKALDIAVNLNLNYLSENSTYFDAYKLSLEVVKDLFPNDVIVMDAVIEAWKAVGIDENRLLEVNDKELVLNTYIFDNRAEWAINVCNEELQDLDIEFRNESNITIPKETTMYVEFVFEYNVNDNGIFKIIKDTIKKEHKLLNDFSKDSSIFFNVSYTIENETLISNGMNMYSNIHFDNNLFNDIQKRVSIHNFEVVDDSLQYRAYTSNFYILDACTEDGEVLYPSYSIVSKSCNFGNIDFELEISGPEGVEKHTIIGENSRTSSNFILSFDNNLINNSQAGNNRDLTLSLFSLVNGKRYLLKRDIMGNNYKDHLTNSKVIDFTSEEESLKYLNLEQSILLSEVTYNGSLKLYSDPTLSGIVNDCYDPEFIFDNSIDDFFGGHNFLQICTDLHGLSNPVLSFDLKLSSDNPYQAAVKVRQDYKPLHNGLIYNTADNQHKYAMALSEVEGFSNVEMVIFLEGTTATIDNIKLTGTVGTEDLGVGMVQHNNPVHDFINFTWPNIQKGRLQIYNLQGILVKDVFFNDQIAEINTTFFANGMYVFKYQNEGISGSGKFVVVHP